MKKFLLVVAMLLTFITTVNAAVESETLKQACDKENLNCNITDREESASRPNIYVFRGDGCSYCKQLIEYLASIYSGYTSQVDVVIYEVANNTQNYVLYSEVASKFGDKVEGYPYMVIGKTVFDGYNPTTYNDQIKDAIELLVQSEDKYDVVKSVESGDMSRVDLEDVGGSGAIIVLAIIGVIVVGVIIYSAIKRED